VIAAQLGEQARVIAGYQAALPGDTAALDFASQQVQRATQLEQGGFGTTERRQSAQSEIAQRQAGLKKDQDALSASQAHAQVLQAQLKQADAEIARRQAQLDQARLNLSYTRIYAPAGGSVASRTVQVGSYIQPGQTLFSAVPLHTFVVANFKETQLAHMQVGQPVRIHVDTYPGRVFRGHVDSFQRGTGSTFALLPPENATGNFVKVVQRLPVKILVDEPAATAALLAPGMSVEPQVAVRAPPPWLSWIIR
jgi:membrane fusion protein (multidrug efflux system)